jgi:UV DNA damage repair endonuclease
VLHPQIPNPLWRAHQICSDQDIPLVLDPNVENCLRSVDDEEFYVDSLFPTYLKLLHSMQALGWQPVIDRYMRFMMKGNYSQQDIRTVKNSLMRIIIVTNNWRQVPIEEYIDSNDL